MSDLPIVWLSGFPRSGSTLLAGLMAQNPLNHVTATNALVDLVVVVRNQWTQNEAFKAQGIPNVLPRITRMLKSMIHGFYEPEFAAGKTVIDKDRFALANIDLLNTILDRPVKVIVTVRDCAGMCASLEKLHHDNPLTALPRNAQQQIKAQTCRGRCEQYLSEDATLGLHVNRFRDALHRFGKQLIIVPYGKLVADPVGIVRRLHVDLGLPPFDCDPSAVKMAAPEDDFASGRVLPFHAVRSQVDSAAVNRGREILDLDTKAWLDADYPLVNVYAAGDYLNGV